MKNFPRNPSPRATKSQNEVNMIKHDAKEAFPLKAEERGFRHVSEIKIHERYLKLYNRKIQFPTESKRPVNP